MLALHMHHHISIEENVYLIYTNKNFPKQRNNNDIIVENENDSYYHTISTMVSHKDGVV
jgi:uncharacterized protein YozE (UPF0346 family)